MVSSAGTHTISHLPDDCLGNILGQTLQSMDDYCRYRLVCKKWLACTNLPLVIEKFFSRSVLELWPNTFHPVTNEVPKGIAYDSRYLLVQRLANKAVDFLIKFGLHTSCKALKITARNVVLLEDPLLLKIASNFPLLEELHMGNYGRDDSCDEKPEDKVQGITDAAVASLVACSRLRSLILTTKCGEVSIKGLSALRSCTNICELTILPKRAMSCQEIEKIASLGSLTRLSISLPDTDKFDVQSLKALSALTTLTLRNRTNGYIAIASSNLISTIGSLPTLTHLSLERLRGLDLQAALQLSGKQSQLQRLEVIDCDFTCEHIEQLTKAAHLQELTLKQCYFGLENIEDLVATLKKVVFIVSQAPTLTAFHIDKPYGVKESDIEEMKKTLALSSSLRTFTIAGIARDLKREVTSCGQDQLVNQ